MRVYRHDLSICLFLVITMGIFLMASSVFTGSGSKADLTKSSWIRRLFQNLLGYCAVFVPGFLIIKYVHKISYIDIQQKGYLWPLIRQCIYGQDGELIPTISEKPGTSKSSSGPGGSSYVTQSGFILMFCFAGLQFSYLTWGLLQEKIMTRSYEGSKFSDSQFLVFVNRVFGLIIAWSYVNFIEAESRSRSAKVPLYKYSYCALTNVMSSWFQYEALKFVSFPTQVLAKTCKIIPVMLMGKVISNKSYEFYEYITAILISLGMILFISGSSDYIQVGMATTDSVTLVGVSGLLILVLYMVFDSFTSNWQSELFQTYRMSSFQMMAGVNLFSLLLTGVSLFQQGSFGQSTKFLAEHGDFALDCLILSICSAIGQLFIYFTIEKFGPVVFTIIMTIRQALAVVLSCIFYGHPISGLGILGVLLLFLSIFLRIYCSYRMKQIKTKKSLTTTITLSSGSTVKM